MAMIPRRGTLGAFVVKHRFAWELSMGALALTYVGLSTWDDDFHGSAPEALLLGMAALFLVEFCVRCWDAPSRWAYARTHWIDFVSCIPFVGFLRPFRLLRLVRLGIGFRLLAAIELKSGERHGLSYLLPALIIVWAAAAFSVWSLEHDVNPGLATYGDALYWAVITMTTIGYGDIHPVTAAGRVIAGLLAFAGIGMMGVVSAQLTAHWIHRGEGDPIHGELRALRREVAELKELLSRAPEGEATLVPTGRRATRPRRSP
jgi:voltage-gated potassium channel